MKPIDIRTVMHDATWDTIGRATGGNWVHKPLRTYVEHVWLPVQVVRLLADAANQQLTEWNHE